MAQTIELESIRRLDIQPGETLVVGLPEEATRRDVAQAQDARRAVLPDVKVIVTNRTLDLTVVGDGCPSSPA